jgi:Pvc16 N-terminal domain
MSNYLSIATVTAALQRMLQASVQKDVDGARVTTVRPGSLSSSGTPESGVNLFLYQVSRNTALNNADAIPSRSKGGITKRQAAVDLFYMVSCYGNEPELEPQRLLGSVIRTLNDQPLLTEAMIRETTLDSTFRYLADSNLADQMQQALIIPINMDLEDLSKTWSVFFQTPYLLSTVYKVMVVMIDGDEAMKRALPVRDRNLGGIVPFAQQPIVEQVISQSGRFEPILADSTLLILGKQFDGAETRVRISGIDIVPAEISAEQIIVPLVLVPAHLLRAGVQNLQIIHQVSTGTPHPPYRNVESNVTPFVLRPTIKALSVQPVEQNDDLRTANVTVQVNLPVGVKQRVVLALNEWTIDRPKIYLFEAQPREQETDALIIPVVDVKAGEYLVRLHVDGAESQLGVDTQPDSPTFNWYNSPKVVI